MAKLVVCGRGGSGKSTWVVLLAKALLPKQKVLVVDADESNLGLPILLGVEPPRSTLMEALGGKGRVREALLKVLRGVERGQESFFEGTLDIDALPSEALSVKDGLSFVRIGKEEHALEGCACPMGFLARDFLRNLNDQNLWVLIDTEAGVEHFGRGIVSEVDLVLYVAEPSFESFLLLKKAKRMTEEAQKPFLVVGNKVGEDTKEMFLQRLKEEGVLPLGILPHLEEIRISHLLGRPIEFKHPQVEKALRGLEEVLHGINP